MITQNSGFKNIFCAGLVSLIQIITNWGRATQKQKEREPENRFPLQRCLILY